MAIVGSVISGSPEVLEKVPQTSVNVKKFVWKNCLVLGFGWLFLFMGFGPIYIIQNSLNSTQGLGTVSLSVNTATSIIGCTFFTTPVIKKLGYKWSMITGFSSVLFYIAANFYPTWATLIPAAIISGMGTSFLWTAQYTYTTKMTKKYAEEYGLDVGPVGTKFFGIFFTLFYLSAIFGNLASSLILGLGTSPPPTLTSSAVNGTVLPNRFLPYNADLICGADYCNEDLGIHFKPGQQAVTTNVTVNYWIGNRMLNRSSDEFPTIAQQGNNRNPSVVRVYGLCTFSLLAAIIGIILISLLLDHLSELNVSDNTDEAQESTWRGFVATLMTFRNPKQLLLLPLIFYNGMDNYFLNTEFTKAYITCTIGIEYIGVMTACAGALSLVSSFFGGWFNSKRTRWVPFVLGALAHLIPAIVILYWKPTMDNATVHYIIASVWGFGSGIWSTQIAAFYSVVFKENLEASLANLVLWNSVAQMIMFGLSHILCVKVKIYMVIGILSLGMLGYFTVEAIMLFENHKKKKYNKTISMASFAKQDGNELNN